ncbi:hypothetical protein X777_06530 [Ooceraea biroi]|uniref:Uncharacterized protein n=1 Tax=Ooceraea biroi TaxID=2015173 RepID=A0A026WEJ5_OOCBI|nr:hypothetical protein X777_06530 [Ooceraea biroi]
MMSLPREKERDREKPPSRAALVCSTASEVRLSRWPSRTSDRRCVRNSTPIQRDKSEPCTSCCWHGDRVEVTGSVLMWTILGSVVDGCSCPRGRRRLAF